MHKSKIIALDTENNEHGDLGIWSIAYRDSNGRIEVVSVNGKYNKTELATVFNDVDEICFHNYKWDGRVLLRNGMPMPPVGKVRDTMIAAYCLGMGRQEPRDSAKSGDQMVGGLGLKYLGRRHLGLEMKTWQETKDDPEIFETYNATDSVATYCLYEKWRPELETRARYFYDIDMPLLDTLMCMEDRGIVVDPKFLQAYALELDAQLKANELPLNPFSHQQVAKYVYEDLGIEPTKFTKDKKPSVDKEVLETIDDPIVKKILEYRELYKEKTTYVENYLDHMDLGNRIHCDFKQTSTATSRLSSARPNLQNVTKSEKLRGLFGAAEGHSLIRADWWQIELCVFAAIAKEERMLEALAKGIKIHTLTSQDIGLPYDDAKTINFLMLYGGTPWKISQEFHIPIDQAVALEKKYYATYPRIKQYHQEQIAKAHNERRVTLWTGRSRRLDGMYSGNRMVIRESEREAVNTPIQGGAAEVVKRVMNRLHYDHHAPMNLQVHDELLFEVPDRDVMDYAKFLFDFCPTVTEINGLRFPVEVGIGKNWAEAHANTVFKPEAK